MVKLSRNISVCLFRKDVDRNGIIIKYLINYCSMGNVEINRMEI